MALRAAVVFSMIFLAGCQTEDGGGRRPSATGRLQPLYEPN